MKFDKKYKHFSQENAIWNVIYKQQLCLGLSVLDFG